MKAANNKHNRVQSALVRELRRCFDLAMDSWELFANKNTYEREHRRKIADTAIAYWREMLMCVQSHNYTEALIHAQSARSLAVQWTHANAEEVAVQRLKNLLETNNEKTVST